ncbi:hypothetical protein [Actinomycetospora soli]|uniref:hypothetical protein n=1 Tax=Actinomycetospora soli TaxID=2893887 RepID=UPI001E548BEF|nr:hypothetical protein [Actinomycetospora soli]MCD2185725.1 hypothetical protein [Actinomycetospora soli]
MDWSAVPGLLDRAIALQQPQVDLTLRIVRARSDRTPAQVVTVLERTYLTTVTTAGASVGASAGAPGVGTTLAVALGGGELAFSLNAAVLHALAVSAVHGVRPEEVERRRLLVLAVLGGARGTQIVEEAAGVVGGTWGAAAVRHVPAGQLLKVQRALGQQFVTTYGAAQGRVVWGKVLPFGFGAVLGGVGNALVARGVIANVRRALGDPPHTWPDAA